MTKQLPALDDRDGQVEVLTQALIWALLSGGEQPYPVPAFEVRKIAAMAYDCGVRQTEDRSTEIELPGWIKEQVREQAEVSDTPPADLFAEASTGLVGEAPVLPENVTVASAVDA